MSQPSRSDGGRWALAGFLYQIVGLCGLRASALNGVSEAQELDVVFSLVRDGAIESERFDQDAVIRSLVAGQDERFSLVQFKYSGTTPPKPIYRDEFDAIVAGFRKSAIQAESHGHRVTGYFLLTNRPVARVSELKPEDCDAEAVCPFEDDGIPSVGPNAEAGHVTSPTAKATRPRDARTEAIRQELHIHTNLPMDFWTKELAHFSDRLGCVGEETEAGIDRLVGMVVRGSAGRDQVFIDKADLAAAFTDCRTASPMTLENVSTRSISQIEDFSKHLHPGRPVRRILLDQLGSAIRQRALVLIQGPGGSGKSTALADWAQRLASSISHSNSLVVVIFSAWDIPSKLITEIVCNQFDLPERHSVRRNDPPTLSLDRLEVALPNPVHPVVAIGLDGVDEGASLSDQHRRVREALKWFWDEDRKALNEGRAPRATIVVTSRDREFVESCLDQDLAGYRPTNLRLESIEIGDFTRSELLMASHQDCPWSYGRIYGTLASSGSLPEFEGEYKALPRPMDSLTEDEHPTPVNSDVLDSLLHPAMWRAIIQLGPDVGSRALDGDVAAIEELARSFTHDWFCRKAQRRQFRQLSSDEVVAILSKIALATHAKGEVLSYVDDWESPVRELVSSSICRALYKEALSAGYVDEVSRFQWRWRHRLCVRYLVAATSIERA
jgi:hypothetical protein